MQFPEPRPGVLVATWASPVKLCRSRRVGATCLPHLSDHFSFGVPLDPLCFSPLTCFPQRPRWFSSLTHPSHDSCTVLVVYTHMRKLLPSSRVKPFPLLTPPLPQPILADKIWSCRGCPGVTWSFLLTGIESPAPPSRRPYPDFVAALRP